MSQLHKEQESLDFESHFLVFTVDEVRFAKAPSRVEFMAAEMASGSTEEEAIKATAAAERLLDHGVLWGDHYSVTDPEGMTHTINKIKAWPIDENTFNAAKEVRWDVNRMDNLSKQVVMDAFEAWTENEIRRRVTD